MRRGYSALTAVLATLLTALPAKADEETGAIRYAFRTLLVPDELPQHSLVIPDNAAWFTGIALPSRAIALAEAVTVSDSRFDLPKGSVLSISTGSYFVACNIVGARTCLIDMNRDGALDAWFRVRGSVMWNEHAERIQRDDIYPITPVVVTELAPDELRRLEPWAFFATRYVGGRLTFCVGGSFTCLKDAPKIKPSDIEQTVEFMGGLYSYRKVEDGKLAIEIRRDPVGTLF